MTTRNRLILGFAAGAVIGAAAALLVAPKTGKETSVFVYGQEKKSETVKLARMNLAVNGLRGEIKQGISYYDDHFDSFGKFDYVSKLT